MITSENIIYDDPWIVPSESEIDSFGDSMPLSPYELAYEAVVSFSDMSSTQIDQMNVVVKNHFSRQPQNGLRFLKLSHLTNNFAKS